MREHVFVSMKLYDRLPVSKNARQLRKAMAESLAYYHSARDEPENFDSTPDDEQLEWHGVYVAEAYGPSHVATLLARVEQLGWGTSDGTDRLTLPDWIVKNRGRSSGVGFYPLNVITRTRVGPASGAVQAPLPTGVSHVRGVVLSPTPALPLIVIFFVFDDELAGRVERSLRKRYATQAERLSDSGWRLHTPANLKLDKVVAQRRELREVGQSFFRSHLPGLFSADADGELPACEVFTTAKPKPFTPEQENEAQSPCNTREGLMGIWASYEVLRKYHALYFMTADRPIPDTARREGGST